MKGYTAHAYLLECLTNLHAGSGDADYGVIDKRVQRDPATSFPAIHSSSMKGALREYFDGLTGFANAGAKEAFITRIFGSEPRPQGEVVQGNYRFFGASLLVLPVRSLSRPFFRATCKALLDEYERKADDFILANTFSLNALLACGTAPFTFQNTCAWLEDVEANPATTALPNGPSTLLGDDLAVLTDEQMLDLAKHLPVIARNQLEDGISQNLWYEEVVPRESRFFFFVLAPEGDSDFQVFNNNLHNQVVQIGGNATVGYGYCKLTKF